MRRSVVDLSLAGIAILMLIGSLCAGCHKSDTASGPAGAQPAAAPATPSAQMAQSIQSIQNNPQLSPQIKAQLIQRMQSPDGRPPGAPAAPMAHE